MSFKKFNIWKMKIEFVMFGKEKIMLDIVIGIYTTSECVHVGLFFVGVIL